MTARVRHLIFAAISGLLVVAVATISSPRLIAPAGATTFSGSVYTFEGGGWGHGVGMSQYGAYGMALQGSTADQIIRHYYTGTQISTRSDISTIRVLLAEGQSRFDIEARGAVALPDFGATLPASGGMVVTGSGSNVVVTSSAIGGTRTVSSLTVPLSAANKGVTITQSGGHSYQYGTLSITSSGSKLQARLIDLPMQHYLYGIREMPASWSPAALQAQALAARTYALRHVQSAAAKSRSYDVGTTTTYQVYTGETGLHPNWVAAVDATNNNVITYNGALIDAVYFSSSGGYTAASETVWVSALPYLRPVPDPYDKMAANKNSNKVRTFTAQQLGSWFGVETVTSITVTGASVPDGRVNKATFTVVGTAGSKTMGGIAFRDTINSKVPADQRFLGTRIVLKSGSGGAVAPPPSHTMATGSVTYAGATGRTVTITGRIIDPDGRNTVRIVSTMGREQGVYVRTTGSRGDFSVSWVGSPGTRNVCVTALDNPTQQVINLGCHDVVVK